MSDNSSLLLFVGSPRKKGTSYSFARTIKMLAEEMGRAVEIVFIIDYYDEKENISDLTNILHRHNTIGLVMPMYVDTLPAPVIWFLEQLSEKLKDGLSQKRFFAVSQCGFPDVNLLQPSLESCRLFAISNEMYWTGGLGYGGGAIIDGAFLEDLGKKGETITLGFEMALKDIFSDRTIRKEAQDIITVKIPKLIYWPLAVYLNHQSKKKARKYGIRKLGGPVPLD